MTKYKRVIIKLSGEALAGPKKTGIDTETLECIADQIIDVARIGVEVGIVVGGGNFWRGRSCEDMDRPTADHMGMLATAINALALQDAIERKGQPTRVMTAIEMKAVAEPYIRRRAIRHLEKGRVVIFACGIGDPFFSTDTTAALRAAEINAEVILKATNVDGVYDADPNKVNGAKCFKTLGYFDVLERNLKVMDTTAITFCMDNNIPLVVFSMIKKGNIMRVINGEPVGTVISKDTKPEYQD